VEAEFADGGHGYVVLCRRSYAPDMDSQREDFLQALRALVGDDGVVTDAAELVEYGRDRTRVFEAAPSAAVFPRSTEEVAHVLRLCHEREVAVVPSGGRTGLAGGAVAASGEVVLSLERMRRVDDVDVAAQTVRVDAGAVTERVHEAAAEHGLTWPIDLAAKGSCTIGGNLATNAGGVRVIRYGLTREWVLGVRAVLMDGRVLDLGGALEKDNTGLDLVRLLVGSEGTLAVITEATLKLTSLPEDSRVLFFGVDSVARSLELLEQARRGPFTIAAFEVLTHACLEVVLERSGDSSPFASPHTAYALLEVETPTDELDDWLASVFEAGLVEDGVRAASAARARALWALRENISEELSRRGPVHKNDISVPVASLPRLVHEVESLFAARYADLSLFLYGHVGDGNLHVNATPGPGMSVEDFRARTAELDDDVYGLLPPFGGSVSAEHGIGLLKRGHLGVSRSEAELEVMRGIKRVFDPKGLLNPGKLFDV
jgi:glycolate oxidase subunit GlcD